MVPKSMAQQSGPYHMLPARHHPLIDDFRRIVSSGVYMYTLLHHRVAPRTQCFPSLVPAWLDLGLCVSLVGGHCRGRWGTLNEVLGADKRRIDLLNT